MKILIIGGAGFVGSSLAHELIKGPNNHLTLIDDLSFGYFERVSDLISEVNFINISAFDYLLNTHDCFDVIVNCAAVAPLPNNQINHYQSLNLNVALPGAIVDYMRRTKTPKLVHFSSSAVYEYSEPIPSVEDCHLSPRLMYPLSKSMSETYLSTTAENYGIDVTAIRLFNLYGPRQDYFRQQPPFLGYAIKNHLQSRPITVFASPEAKRDYIYIDDLISFIKLDIQREVNPNRFEAFNVGSGRSFSIYSLMDILSDITGRKVEYEIGEARNFWGSFKSIESDEISLKTELIDNEINKVSEASISKAKNILGWSPSVSMSEGLEKCVEYAKGLEL